MRGIHAEGALDISAEICRQREPEHIGNLYKSQRLVSQKAGYVKRRIAVNPIVRRIAADFFRYLRKVFRRDAQRIGII